MTGADRGTPTIRISLGKNGFEPVVDLSSGVAPEWNERAFFWCIASQIWLLRPLGHACGLTFIT